jgi:hypothetical protein
MDAEQLLKQLLEENFYVRKGDVVYSNLEDEPVDGDLNEKLIEYIKQKKLKVLGA